jgi:hypothetical protein
LSGSARLWIAIATGYMRRKSLTATSLDTHSRSHPRKKNTYLGEGWLTVPFHCQTTRVVAVVSPSPLHCPTRCEEPAGRRARSMAANAFPTWKGAQSPPKRHSSYGDWWRNGQQVSTENQMVERIVCRKSCAESRKNQRLFQKEASEE